MNRVVFERGSDLVPRLIGRAALFQAYTSVLAAPALALGYLRPPPALEFLHSSPTISATFIAVSGVGLYLTAREVNSRLVSRMTVVDNASAIKVETISSFGKQDPFVIVPLRELLAAPFAPKTMQLIQVNGKTVLVDHKGAKTSDVLFFSRNN